VLVEDLCGKVIHRGFIADIGLVHRGLGARRPNGIRTFVGRGQITIDDHHLAGAVPGQFHRGGPADARARPGDQREFALHLARAAAHHRRAFRGGAADVEIDPLAGQPGDDVGARGHHPVPAFDRDHPAAGGNRAGEPLQGGCHEEVPARYQHLHRNGGLRQLRPRR
jgi:hypothetical protein